jgi:hypothetical protein
VLQFWILRSRFGVRDGMTDSEDSRAYGLSHQVKDRLLPLK